MKKEFGYKLTITLNKFSVILLFLVILASIIVLTIYQTERERTKNLNEINQNEVEVRVSNRGIGTSLPVYVGMEKGYFDEEGIKIKLVNFTSGIQVFNYLISGAIDVGQFPIDPILISDSSTLSGIKIFAVAEYSELKNRNFDALLVKSGSPIKSLKDLEGRTIGVNPGITQQILLRHYLSSSDVNVDNVRLMIVEPQSQLDYLSTSKIDAMWAVQPIVTIGLNDGFEKIDSSMLNKLNITYFSVFVFSKDFASTKPETASKFYSSLLKSFQYIENNKNESKLIMGKYTGLVNLTSQIDYLPEFQPLDKEDIKGLTNLFEFYKSKGLLQNTLPPELLTYKIS